MGREYRSRDGNIMGRDGGAMSAMCSPHLEVWNTNRHLSSASPALGKRQTITSHPSLTLRASVTLARSVSEGWHHLPLALRGG